jgi:hypothetical protein
MLVRCIANSPEALGRPEARAFHGVHTDYSDLEVEKEYPVLGLSLSELVLLAFVVVAWEKPFWLPVGLFDFTNATLPGCWKFSVENRVAASGGPADYAKRIAIWGYPKLVEDSTHSDMIVERDPDAMAIFRRELARELGEHDNPPL